MSAEQRAATPKAGERDNYCMEQTPGRPSWICNRAHGHSGDHAAYGSNPDMGPWFVWAPEGSEVP